MQRNSPPHPKHPPISNNNKTKKARSTMDKNNTPKTNRTLPRIVTLAVVGALLCGTAPKAQASTASDIVAGIIGVAAVATVATAIACAEPEPVHVAPPPPPPPPACTVIVGPRPAPVVHVAPPPPRHHHVAPAPKPPRHRAAPAPKPPKPPKGGHAPRGKGRRP